MHARDKIGIICGNGSLPVSLTEACQKKGQDYVLIVLQGQVQDPWYETHPHQVCRLGAIGQILKILKKEQVTHITLAGSLKRPSLSELRPDLTALKWLAKIGVKGQGDDGMLSHIVQLLEEEGYTLLGSHELLPELLVGQGCMNREKPSSKDLEDIQKGFQLAKKIGKLDVGQAVIVEHGLVLSLEGIEGTAALIERTKSLKREKSGVGVLVKACKPQQSLRVDLPSIGPETIEQIKECGLAGIALESGKALILEKKKTVEAADNAGVFIVGITEEDAYEKK